MLKEAWVAHPEWEASLASWYRIVDKADWNNFADVKQTWSNVDIVDDLAVFDISHNRCRLIAFIGYMKHLVFVRAVLSHAEYDEEKWKK
jgi:mRNA interferase HigB